MKERINSIPAIEADTALDQKESGEARIEYVNAKRIFDWVDKLESERSRAELWELRGVITQSAPGADKADEGIIIRHGQKVAGAGLLAPDYLIGVYVLPEYRRHGYGKKLIEESIERLRQRGSKKIHMKVCDLRSLRLIDRLPEETKNLLQVEEEFYND